MLTGGPPSTQGKGRGETGHSMNDLRDFLLHRMKMSHIYQPVILKTLLLGSGKSIFSRNRLKSPGAG